MGEAPAPDGGRTTGRWWVVTPGWRRWVVLGVLALAVAALICTDEELRVWYRATCGLDPVPRFIGLTALAHTLTKSLHPGLVLLMACAACVAMWDRWREMAKAMIAGVASQAIGIAVLKDLLGRARPETVAGASVFRGPEWGSHAMPSGHAGLAFVLAAVVSGFFPRCRWLLYPLAALIAQARVHMDSHFFSDIFVGAIIGALVGQWAVWRFRRPPEPTRPPP